MLYANIIIKNIPPPGGGGAGGGPGGGGGPPPDFGKGGGGGGPPKRFRVGFRLKIRVKYPKPMVGEAAEEAVVEQAPEVEEVHQ